MYQTKSKWIVNVCRANLAIAADNFFSYQNKNLIQVKIFRKLNISYLLIPYQGVTDVNFLENFDTGHV